MSKENDCNRKNLLAKGAAVLLSVILILPAMPMTVYAKEDVYEVQKGDCLWKIAETYLGDGARSVDIVEWNKDLIQDPNLIYPGMELRIAADTAPQTEESAKAELQSNAENEQKSDTADELQSDIKTDSGKDTSEQSYDKAAGGPYEKGTIKGTTWENEWLGMRLELPEGFRFGALQDYHIFNDEEAATFEFIVDNPSYPGMTMIMAAIQLDINMDEVTDDLLDLLEQTLTAFGMEGVEWKSETVKLGGLSFQHYFSEAEYMDVPIYTEYYMTQKEDIIVYLQLFYMDYDGGDGDVHRDMKALINGFH